MPLRTTYAISGSLARLFKNVIVENTVIYSVEADSFRASLWVILSLECTFAVTASQLETEALQSALDLTSVDIQPRIPTF